MKEDFFKFPSTPYLERIANIEVREDKIMSKSEQNEFLFQRLIVEEKIDGANLGISFDTDGNILTQNRGAYLQIPSTGQWKKLAEWVDQRMDAIFEQITDRCILFGEWCYAQHSIMYDRLPDWFLGFDIYDKKAERFYSCERRNEVFKILGIFQVPQIAHGYFTLSELRKLISKSHFSDKIAEGLYIRFDQGDWSVKRAKLTRPAFIQSIEHHWSRSYIKPNKII